MKFRRFASFFFGSSRPKSTKAQVDEQVEQCEVDQDTDEALSRRCTDDQTLQDIICTVEDYDHQEPPSSSPVPSTTAGNQQMEDAKPQDEDSPPRPSSDYICWLYDIGKELGKGGFGTVYEGTRASE
ncbi:hypothetical protein F2P79_004502 [Pimephales promelas]|nr:hypothetical protein F2P79_004502 [Pimephales promelas]